MPAHSIPRRVEDFIYYYYAKLVVAPSAGFRGNYAFIVDAYQRLKNGEMRMSVYDRELLHLAQTSGQCCFCSTPQPATKIVQVVPENLGGPVGIHNLVMACEECAASKGDKDLVEWWCNHLGKPRDDLPRIAIGLYLKIAHELHTVHFTLNAPCQGLDDIFKILLLRDYGVRR